MSWRRAPTSGPELARAFGRRMLPVALLVAAAAAIVPPAVYAAVSLHRLQARAELDASGLAAAISGVALRQPFFWRYNLAKLVAATEAVRGVEPVGAVRVTGCSGETLVDGTEIGVGLAEARGASAWAPVKARDRVVAWVQVVADERAVRRATTAIGAGSGALGLLLGLLLYLFPTRVVRRLSRALGETLERLATAESELVLANRDLRIRIAEAVREARALSERVVSIQEEERGRIARDLHDSVGQLLTALELELTLLANRASERAAPVASAIELAERTLTELRRVVRDLRPLELEHGGLEEALRGTVERFELRTGVVASFRHEGPRIDDERVATCILRVVQEALTNVSRHARADEVGVSLRNVGAAITLEVQDDGRGFDVQATHGGTGLAGMRERVQFEGGTAKVESAPGEGTRVTVVIQRGGAQEDS